MGILDILNSGLQAYFDATKESKQEQLRKQKFDELGHTPFLFSSNYLNEIMDDCETKEDYEQLLDHMYRHNATEVESYWKIENDIIDHLRGKR